MLAKKSRAERHGVWLNSRDSVVTHEKQPGFSKVLYEQIVRRLMPPILHYC